MLTGDGDNTTPCFQLVAVFPPSFLCHYPAGALCGPVNLILPPKRHHETEFHRVGRSQRLRVRHCR